MSKTNKKEGNPGINATQDGAPGDSNKKDDIFNNPKHKKIIRLVTVMAYMVSVSFVGVTLSAYYLFFWHPPNPRLIKRAHIIAEPRIEFLLSDPIISSNQSTGQESSKFEKNSPTSLVARIADDSFDDGNDKFIDNFSQAVGKKRRKLNESLFVLRNTLMEVLVRGKANNQTAASRDSSLNNPKTDEGSLKTIERGKSAKTNIFGESNRGMKLIKIAENETEIRDPSLKNYNGTSLTLESWTISGDETKYRDRFTNIRNGSSLMSRLKDEKHQVDYNRTRNVATKGEIDQDYVSFLSPNNSDSKRIITKKNMRNNDDILRSVDRNTVDAKSPLNFIINSSDLLDATHSGKLSGAAVSGDTQIEKAAKTTTTTTTRTDLPTVEDEVSQGSEIPVTTQRRKDFLSILIESTSKDNEISSEVPTTPSPEDFRSNSSAPSKNRPETSLFE